jgi:hypothetical protein
MVSPEETPLFSTSRKVKAMARLHDWQNDALASAADNANIEGADFSFSKPSARTRVSNVTQIFTKTLEVSDTQQTVDVAGVSEEMAYQMEKRMKELATDIEKAAFTGTGNTGASGTARRMTGLYAAVTSVNTTGTGTGTEALTEDMFNDTLQAIYDNGGRPNAAYVNSFQKRQISSFTTSNTRYLDTVDAGRLVNFVDVYESDFGVISIRLDQFADTDKVLLATSDQIAFAILRPVKEVEVAKVGDATRAALVGELTLQWGNQKAHGKITGLTTS